MKKENIYETYIRILCSNCKNRTLDWCEIRRNFENNLKCCYYEREVENKGFKKFEGRTAKQEKPIRKR